MKHFSGSFAGAPAGDVLAGRWRLSLVLGYKWVVPDTAIDLTRIIETCDTDKFSELARRCTRKARSVC